jgi:PAS domain S-box-containing protein
VRREPHADRYLGLLDAAEEIGGLGAWEWRPRTGELRWSDNHYRLFGLEPGEVEPSTELILARVHPDDRERLAETLAQPDVAGSLQDYEYRIRREDGAIRYFRVTVSVVEGHGTESALLVGSVQDVTERRATDRAIGVRIAVSDALDHWASYGPEARWTLLARMGEALGAACGVIIVRDGEDLVARTAWHGGDPRFAALASAMLAQQRAAADSDVWRCWKTQEPVIRPFPDDRPASALLGAAEEAGVRSTVCVPAVSGDSTLAVVAFLMADDVDPSEQLARTFTGIGHELGHFFASRRTELEPSILPPRAREVLQRAAMGRTGPEIAADLHVSPATVKRHFEETYARLGVSDRAAAVAEAMRRGLIT